MTQYLYTLTLEQLEALTLDALSSLEVTDGWAHQPWFVTNVEDFNTLYFIEQGEDFC